MPIDPSIPLQIQTPKFETANTLNALSNMQMAQAHSTLYGQQAALQAAKMNVLQNVSKAMSSGDEDAIQQAITQVASVDPDAAGNILKLHQTQRQITAQNKYGQTGNPSDVQAFPDVAETVAKTLSTTDVNARQAALHKLEIGSRAAEGFLAYKGANKVQAWDGALDEMVKSGAYTPDDVKSMYGKPNEMVAARMRAAGMEAARHMEVTSGIPKEHNPASMIITPRDIPDPTYQSADDQLGESPPVPTPGPSKGKDQARANDDKNPIYQEVPKIDLNPNQKQIPGVKMQGIDPVALQAKTEAQEAYSKNVMPAARSAQIRQSELGTIISGLEKSSGKLNTDATAEIRATAARWLYAGGMPAEAIQKATGMNPSEAEVFMKNSGKLAFSQQREQGAREAAQVLSFAIQTNPNLLMTKEGNLMVAKLMQSQAQWDADQAKYGGEFYRKNQHMVGFENWWNQNHSLESYTSKVYPSQASGLKSPADAKKGVTYEWPKTGADGKPVREKNGAMVMQHGTWDGEKFVGE